MNCYGLDVLGFNPRGVRFSAPVQTGTGAHPTSCTMGAGSFFQGKGVKRPGNGFNHPPSPSAKFKERIDLYCYSPSGLL